MTLKPADLDAFQKNGLLWAVNQFVLWPLGYALSLSFDVTTGAVTGPIELREHTGQVETIEDESDLPDFDRWEAFVELVRERISKMPQKESEAAIVRLLKLGDVLNQRPQWRYVEPE